MLGLHAAIANHYTRYSLILIGAFSAGSAWLIVSIGMRAGLAMASSLASTVINPICARSLRWRLSRGD